MKVHLIHTTDFSEEDFENVINLLNSYPGAIEFLKGGTMNLSAHGGVKIFNNKTKFERQEEVRSFYSPMFSNNTKESYKRPVFPLKKKYYTWKQLFEAIEEFKLEQNIDKDDFVFLLTNQYNEKNWFAFIGPSMRTAFIHTDDWPWFFGDSTDIRFPIAYEVVVWLIRALMSENQKEIVSRFHKKTLGCLNDFCKHKADITIKMRTADICESCMQVLKEKDVSPHYLNQLFSVMDGIRSNLMFRKRVGLINKDSRIKVDIDSKKIFLIDFGNLDVRLNPKELSLYLLFLNHPEGLVLNSLCDYEKELYSYYQKVSSRLQVSEMIFTVKRLTNYLDNELNITISRIKSKFKKAVGEELSKNYYIQTLHNGKYGIPLDKEGVVVE